jgi:hypothetical protein
MGFFPKLRRKKDDKPLNRKQVDTVLQDALAPYIKREELQGYLRKIEKDKKAKAKWDGLSDRTKIRLLRYLANKKEEQHGKR